MAPRMKTHVAFVQNNQQLPETQPHSDSAMNTANEQQDPADVEVRALERRLGLPEGFWERLSEEDDWSCVVKLNALIEAASTHALVARLRCQEILEPLSHLELAGTRCGKTAFLSALDCLTKQQITFIRKLAELRNDLVHNVTNASFSFASWLESMEAGRRRGFVTALGYVFGDPVVHVKTGKRTPLAAFFAINPKVVVLLGARDVLACLHLEYAAADIRVMEEELEAVRKFSESLDVKAIPDLAETLAALYAESKEGNSPRGAKQGSSVSSQAIGTPAAGEVKSP